VLLVRTERQNSQKQKNSRKKAKRTKAKWNQHPADLIYDGKQMRMGQDRKVSDPIWTGKPM